MGRMKQLLGDGPQPTIGDARRQGVTQFVVRCPPPCKHIATVKFDVLGLPDTTVFHDIPAKKRLRCTECGHVATEIETTWEEHIAYGNGKRPLGDWIVVARTPTGEEMRSSALPSRERAIGFAHDLADKGDTVLRIEGPMGDVTAEDIEAERAARRQQRW